MSEIDSLVLSREEESRSETEEGGASTMKMCKIDCFASAREMLRRFIDESAILRADEARDEYWLRALLSKAGHCLWSEIGPTMPMGPKDNIQAKQQKNEFHHIAGCNWPVCLKETDVQSPFLQM